MQRNVCWLDPSHEKHWANLTTSDFVARVNDDQSNPSWKMLQLLARSSKVATDLLVLANGASRGSNEAAAEEDDQLASSHGQLARRL